MDLGLPELSGVEATYRIHQQSPEIRIIALTGHEDQEQIQAALHAGATSALRKDMSVETIIAAIRDAYERPLIQSRFTHHSTLSTHDSHLTDRQLEILSLLVHGHSNPEIAEKMFLSRSTVKNHVSHILEKLHVKNRAGAVAVALERKLVHMDRPNHLS